MVSGRYSILIISKAKVSASKRLCNNININMETFTDDTVVALASFLSPHDMLNLALTCKRFGDKNGTTTSRSRRLAARESRKSGGSDREVRQRTESISLMEAAAYTLLLTKWTDEERNALPRRDEESWIGVYQEFLKLFRSPLQFDKLAGESIRYVGRSGKTRVCLLKRSLTGSAVFSSAICSNIMRAGKHHVSFQVNDINPTVSRGITLGIMRPTTKDITSLAKCTPFHDDLSRFSLKDYELLHNYNVDSCVISTPLGIGMTRRRWKEWEESELLAMNEEQRAEAKRKSRNWPFGWEGREPTQEASFKIGMVLDLDEGTLDVYKNGRRLGTLMSGLVGEYCWVVTLLSAYQDKKVSVTIGR